jgi:hypothetical protein
MAARGIREPEDGRDPDALVRKETVEEARSHLPSVTSPGPAIPVHWREVDWSDWKRTGGADGQRGGGSGVGPAARPSSVMEKSPMGWNREEDHRRERVGLVGCDLTDADGVRGA